jgi:hypothetical protein
MNNLPSIVLTPQNTNNNYDPSIINAPQKPKNTINKINNLEPRKLFDD